MVSKNITRLANRLNDEFNLNVHPENFQRTYAGVNMKRKGAFVWLFNESATSASGLGFIGGCEPISKYITKKNKLLMQKDRFGEVEIYVYTPADAGYKNIK